MFISKEALGFIVLITIVFAIINVIVTNIEVPEREEQNRKALQRVVAAMLLALVITIIISLYPDIKF